MKAELRIQNEEGRKRRLVGSKWPCAAAQGGHLCPSLAVPLLSQRVTGQFLILDTWSLILSCMRDAPPKPAEPRPGLYRHYKDNPYRVIGLALHSETREWLVVYEALHGEGGLFVRPAAMFVETVEVKGQRVPRFARVGD